MNKIITTLMLFLTMIPLFQAQEGTRYIDEIFDEVNVSTDQMYGANITILTAPTPTLDTLLYDLYMPVGDTLQNRPMVVVLHTGAFLPKGLLSATGDKDDYANQQVCMRLAQRGYVAASVQYRLGWDPQNSDVTVRTATIIQAAYRSIQDILTFIRFANMTVENGNPFGIDPDKIAVFGIGTGGFVALNAAVLQDESEIYIPKFQHPATLDSYIDTLLLGNLTGEVEGPLNVPNHVGYSNAFHYVFSLDGAVGDSSWIEDGADVTVPASCVGVVNHPTTPFGLDLEGNINCDMPVFVSQTGDYVVDLAGTACVINKFNALGINTPIDHPFDDEITQAISERQYAQDHMWPIHLPGEQAGPWEYWDSTFWKNVPHPLNPFISLHDVGLLTNPDMSMEKANAYIDTALWFFAPRACVALGLGGCQTASNNNLSAEDFPYTLYPNPADARIEVSMQDGNPIVSADIYDQTGRLLISQAGGQESRIGIDISDLPTGIYILKIHLKEGILTAKVMKQ